MILASKTFFTIPRKEVQSLKAFDADGALVVAVAPNAHLHALDDVAFAYRRTVVAEPTSDDEIERLARSRVSTSAGSGPCKRTWPCLQTESKPKAPRPLGGGTSV
jgi:hypothetical protein